MLAAELGTAVTPIHMKHKNLFMLGLMLCIGLAGKAQDIISANFKISDHAKGLNQVELTFSKFRLGIGHKGNVIFLEPLGSDQSGDWGDYDAGSSNNTQRYGNLNVTYYDNFDKNKAGKLKSINGFTLDYNSDFDIHDIPGGIKSIGNIKISYNNSFDIHDKPGTIKSIGDIKINYNNSFDIHDKPGTVKSVGPVRIQYFGDFDDSTQRGRVKSIKGNTRAIHVTRI